MLFLRAPQQGLERARPGCRVTSFGKTVPSLCPDTRKEKLTIGIHTLLRALDKVLHVIKRKQEILPFWPPGDKNLAFPTSQVGIPEARDKGLHHIFWPTSCHILSLSPGLRQHGVFRTALIVDVTICIQGQQTAFHKSQLECGFASGGSFTGTQPFLLDYILPKFSILLQ